MKKIVFKNEPSVETPLSAENLNAMQNNTEEEINRIDSELKTTNTEVNRIDSELKKEINKTGTEVFADNTGKTVTADKWGFYNNTYKNIISTKKLVENDPSMSRRFKIVENGLYKITFEACYSYNFVSGIQVHLNNDMIQRILTSNKDANLIHYMFLNLKKDDFVDIGIYTDAAESFQHKYTSIIFEKIGEYIPPVKA